MPLGSPRKGWGVVSRKKGVAEKSPHVSMLFATRRGEKTKGLRRLPGDGATLGAGIIPRITSVKRELHQWLVETSVLFQFLKRINQLEGCCPCSGLAVQKEDVPKLSWGLGLIYLMFGIFFR